MRSLVIFLLGIAVGVGGMLFLPELTPRREQLNAELNKQIDNLQAQVRDLENQLKGSKTPKSDDENAKKGFPSPSATAK
jgi:hypothetical protein